MTAGVGTQQGEADWVVEGSLMEEGGWVVVVAAPPQEEEGVWLPVAAETQGEELKMVGLPPQEEGFRVLLAVGD